MYIIQAKQLAVKTVKQVVKTNKQTIKVERLFWKIVMQVIKKWNADSIIS